MKYVVKNNGSMSVDIRPKGAGINQCQTVYKRSRIEEPRLNRHRSSFVDIAPTIRKPHSGQAFRKSKCPVEAHRYLNPACLVNEPGFGIALVDGCQAFCENSKALKQRAEIPSRSSYSEAPVGCDVAKPWGPRTAANPS